MDYYTDAAERANDYDYSDEPLQAVVDRQRDVIELMAREIARLQKCVRGIEREGVEIVYHHNCYEPRANGRYENF